MYTRRDLFTEEEDDFYEALFTETQTKFASFVQQVGAGSPVGLVAGGCVAGGCVAGPAVGWARERLNCVGMRACMCLYVLCMRV